jgi:hypothetical protein
MRMHPARVRHVPRVPTVLAASALAGAAAVARADPQALSPPGETPPTPPTPPSALILPVVTHGLEGGLRAGLASVDYTTGTLDGNPELVGTGWWVEGELGWHHGNWTFGGFVSFLDHHDSNTGQSYDGPTSWTLRLHVFDVGARATWHHGVFSIGAGLPIVIGRPYGLETVDLGPCQMTGASGLIPTYAEGWDYSPGVELHAAIGVPIVNNVAFQLFGLVQEDFLGTTARIGIGFAF